MNAGADLNTNRLTAKLRNFVSLSAEDRAALDLLMAGTARGFPARHDLLEEGRRPAYVNFILSGWAYRFKQLEDGRRQIIAFILPGDSCDHHILVVNRLDHTVATLTNATVARVSRADVATLSTSDALRRALLWEAESNASVLREWVVTLGQRDARERVAHLFCELLHRLRAVGLTDGTACDMPLTQTDLADATGMTPVHVNRTLQELRSRGLVNWTGRRFVAPDLPALEAAGCFDPSYLQQGQRPDAPPFGQSEDD